MGASRLRIREVCHARRASNNSFDLGDDGDFRDNYAARVHARGGNIALAMRIISLAHRFAVAGPSKLEIRIDISATTIWRAASLSVLGGTSISLWRSLVASPADPL